MKNSILASLFLISIVFMQCTYVPKKNELPILGNPSIVADTVDGQITYDTLDHFIRDFSFVDQDSVWVTNETFAGKVYVADFFFTSCPTICPVMKKEMLRIYEAYENNDEVAILSHTIDPKHDDVATLNSYARRLGVKSSKWHFVTGEKESIFEIAETNYMVVAAEDETAPGGAVHSGAFLLVDQNRHVRGVYDGTVPEQVDLLIADIKKLLTK
jgi:protein SCO1